MELSLLVRTQKDASQSATHFVISGTGPVVAVSGGKTKAKVKPSVSVSMSITMPSSMQLRDDRPVWTCKPESLINTITMLKLA